MYVNPFLGKCGKKKLAMVGAFFHQKFNKIDRFRIYFWWKGCERCPTSGGRNEVCEIREQRRRGREGSGTGSLGSGIKAMVSGKGRRERGRVRLQIGQIRPEAGAHYLYELLPEANYCAYYLAWHYHQSSDCVWLKLSFFRCHRISHRLRSLVISVCAHIASSVQSSAIVPFGSGALSLSKGKREKGNERTVIVAIWSSSWPSLSWFVSIAALLGNPLTRFIDVALKTYFPDFLRRQVTFPLSIIRLSQSIRIHSSSTKAAHLCVLMRIRCCGLGIKTSGYCQQNLIKIFKIFCSLAKEIVLV